MQYVGHLDLHRVWERTFRRAGLPLQYSQGFHPQPHLSLACALPVGFTSQGELLDAWIDGNIPISQLEQTLVSALPPGLDILELSEVDERAPALQTLVASAVYQISFIDAVAGLAERVGAIVAAEHISRVRRDKPYDLRPLIETIELMPSASNGSSVMLVQLAARPGATGRPEELLDEMGIRFENTRVHRTQLVLITN